MVVTLSALVTSGPLDWGIQLRVLDAIAVPKLGTQSGDGSRRDFLIAGEVCVLHFSVELGDPFVQRIGDLLSRIGVLQFVFIIRTGSE